MHSSRPLSPQARPQTARHLSSYRKWKNRAFAHTTLAIISTDDLFNQVIFTQLISRLAPPESNPNATRTLILVHRRELVEQAYRHCRNAYPSLSIEIEMGNMHAGGSADITIASVRSLCSGNRIEKFDPMGFKLILVDEAHHIVAPGYMECLKYFGLLEQPPGSAAERHGSPALVGVSATMSRFDGLRLGAAIDRIVYHKDYVDMIGEKWLSDVIFTTVQSKADISKVKRGAGGDFQPGELSRAVNTEQINHITVGAWLARAKLRESTLVFCVDIHHVVELTNTFRKHGIDARFVTGDTPKADRGQRLEDFKARSFPVMVNCGVFTEGTDIPNVDCVLLARPTRSRNLLVQMIGRGMRLFPGKKDCHVIDMVASLNTGIVTTPTLFGLDPSELVEEADVKMLRNLKERSEERKRTTHNQTSVGTPRDFDPNKAQGRTITFTDYDSVFDLIEDTSGERHIRGISQLAWVQVSDGKYILTTNTKDYLSIEQVEKAVFEVKLTLKIPPASPVVGSHRKSPFMKPRQLAKAATLIDAVHAADTFATEKYPWVLISKEQPWRHKPASDEQLGFLNSMRSADDQLTADDVTKGRAGDMISKLKHGARGQFGKLAAKKKRVQKEEERKDDLEKAKAREQVQIGPLLD